MAHTHEFDCKSCGAHIDSREELDQHIREHHPDMAARGSQASGGSASPMGGGPGGLGQSPPDRSGERS